MILRGWLGFFICKLSCLANSCGGDVEGNCDCWNVWYIEAADWQCERELLYVRIAL